MTKEVVTTDLLGLRRRSCIKDAPIRRNRFQPELTRLNDD